MNAKIKKLGLKGNYVACHDSLDEVKHQLLQYFHGERQGFDISVDLHGTVFQKKVWQALRGQAIRLSEKLDYGIIGVNDGAISTAQAPFGGMKQSGIGREGGHYGIDEFVEVKYISLQY